MNSSNEGKRLIAESERFLRDLFDRLERVARLPELKKAGTMQMALRVASEKSGVSHLIQELKRNLKN